MKEQHTPDLVPEHPIVLCHGFFGFTKLTMPGTDTVHYYYQIVEYLRHLGCNVIVPRLSKSGGIHTRARQLKSAIAHISSPVHLIAHSMSGLDSRYFITHLGGHKQTNTLITLGTPHRGSSFAEWWLQHQDHVLSFIDRLQIDLTGFHHLTRHFLQNTFNPNTPNHSDVQYFSYSGDRSRGFFLPHHRYAHQYVIEQEGPNDGVVSVKSARWGNHVRTLHASHMGMVNWGTQFDGIAFFRELLDLLTRTE